MSKVSMAICVALLASASAVVAQDSDPIPPFSVKVVGEDAVVTDVDLRGTYTLVSFWSTTCTTCVAELPTLQEVHDRFGDRLRILSISRDRDEDVVQAFRDTRHPMPWANAWAGPNSDVFSGFGVRGTPHNIVVAPDGRIVAGPQELVGSRLLREVEQLVGEEAE